MQEVNKNELKSFIDITVHSRVIVRTLQLKENGMFIVLLCTIFLEKKKKVIQRNPINLEQHLEKVHLFTD